MNSRIAQRQAEQRQQEAAAKAAQGYTPAYDSLTSQINSLTKKLEESQAATLKNMVKPMDDGTTSIIGGKNMYGFDVPDYQTMTKADGTLGDNFKEKISENALNLRDFGKSFNADLDPRMKLGMNDAQMKLKDAAMSTGDMPEYALMRTQLQNKFNGDMSLADAKRQGTMATQQANIAMRGGLGGGAAERMGNMSLRNAMMENQMAQGQNRDANLNLSLQNAQARTGLLKDVGNIQQGIDSNNINMLNNQQNKKLDTLSNFVGMENNMQTQNINRLAQDRQNQNLQRFGIFDKNMEAWGAKQTADGQRAAGGGGGGGMSVICTELYIQEKLTRDEYLAAHNYGSKLPVEMFVGYLTISKPIVKLMRKSDRFSNLFVNWARCLAKGEPNTFTKIIMPIATVVGHIKLKLEPDFLLRMMAR
jgi:hypothetical protein